MVQKAGKYFGYIQEEERLMPILKRLTSKAYLGKDYAESTAGPNAVTPEKIDGVCLIHSAVVPVFFKHA